MSAERHGDCASIRPQLDALVDRELSGMECAEVRDHCSECAHCREEVAVLDVLSTRIRHACSDPVPQDLCDEILHTLGGERSEPTIA